MSREYNINFLVDMGFPRDMATEAIKVNGYVEPAIAWCYKKQQSAIGYSLGGGGGQALGSAPSGGGQALGGGGQTLGGQTLGGAPSDELPFIPPETETPQEPKRVLTAEEREAALEKIKQRIAEKKKQDAIDNEVSDIEKEKFRRQEGKEAQATKEAWEKSEAEREAMIKKREKERDRMAREKIREQIRIDQLNREAEDRQRRGEVVVQVPKEQIPKREYDTCTIQIRMPDNSRLQSDFKATDTIRNVIEYINSNRKDGTKPITLSTTFPRKVYSGPLLDSTLKDADMAPRGMFVASYT